MENALLAILHFSLMIKFRVCMLDKPRRYIFEQIARHIETLVDEEEAAIMKIYYTKAVTLVIRYAAFVGMAFGFYDTLPVWRMFFNYYFNNGTIVKEIPFYVDYLVDEQEYFIYILVHLTMVVLTGIIIELGFEMCYFLTVRHVAALFEIVKLRLKVASEYFHRRGQNEISNSDEQKAFKIILSAVKLHIEAKILVESVNEIYQNCWLVILLLNMASFAPLPIAVIVYLHHPLELFRRAMVVAAMLVHFYVIFLQGQMIIDHSSSIFDACYSFSFNSSKRCRFAISMMMMQSLKHCRLTGVLLDLSMETYCQMLKTALSYISMFAALDITIDH